MTGAIYTVGHSNRSLEPFLDLLSVHAIQGIADVRAFPASRRWPHFNREPLATALRERGAGYEWIPRLGGRRHGVPAGQSPHTAWTVAGFRQYADYMDSAEFAAGIVQLLALAATRRTAFLCAEALYWRCHRRLIADHLTVLGHRVLHVESPTRVVEHRLPNFARVVEGRLVYDRDTQLELDPG